MDKIHPDNPFSLKISLTELYSNPLIDQLLSVFLNSIGGKDFLILVIGEYQSGKTSFLSKFTSQIEYDVKPFRFKIRKRDDPASNDNYYPAFLYKTKHNQVIILDDAHNLNRQELSIILKNAWNNNTTTKQVILFCEPQINTILSSLLKEMPKKASVNKFYMPSFDKEQTKAYLKHYLELSNFSGKFPFSQKVINKIHKKTKGFPGKINQEAYKYFSNKNSSSLNLKQSKLNLSVIIAITTIILFIIEGFDLFKKTGFIPKHNSNVILSESYQKTIATKKQPLFNNDPIKKNDHIVKTNIVEPILMATVRTEVPSQKQISKPEPVIKSQIMESVSTDTIKKEEKIETVSSPSLFNNKWIMAQEPQEYTIQVMAANAKDAIDRFLKLNINTENEFAYYKMYSNGSIWYKFISGRYETLEKARIACDNLSDELKTFGPWPRHFASIQNDINNFIETNKTH